MKIKVDKFNVFCKKRQREFEILVFEPPEHMWVYDCFPERDILAIDGDKDAYKLLKYAYAILAQDPSKIVYFGVANQGIGDYYASNCNLVLVRPELQFRCSDWYQIKPKLDKRHWEGKYTYNYNKQKLVDYYSHLKKDWYTPGEMKKAQKIAKEKILGDTVFMTVPQINCYKNHYEIAEMIAKYGNGSQGWWWHGWLFCDRDIYEMYEEVKKSEKKAQ